MKNWFHKNFRLIITFAFVIPILTVAIVSISHVTKWYGISNPISWSIYLSVGIEIAALSAMAAIAANMGKKVYFPFIIATIIQFIGNVFFSYMYINPASPEFISWVELSSPILSFMGVESTDIIAHKRFLALFAGGMLPIISLTFLHMLVKFTEGEDQKKDKLITETSETVITDPQGLMAEMTRIRPTEEELSNLENILNEIEKRKSVKKSDVIVEEKDEVITENNPEEVDNFEVNADVVSEEIESPINNEKFEVEVNVISDEEENLENEKKKF